MSEKLQKRFFKEATFIQAGAGFQVLLDGKPVKTPAKSPLELPTERLAAAISQEWQAQSERIDPSTMPLTRRANAAIDRVSTQHGDVVALLVEYAGSDLLCYRAEHPQELAARQAQAWDPLLDWAAETYGAQLHSTQSVMHVAQPADSLARLTEGAKDMPAFVLTGFYDLVTLTGSYVIALAALGHAFEAADLWVWSQIDEGWQEEKWGADDEAQQVAANKKQAFFEALQFLEFATQTP